MPTCQTETYWHLLAEAERIEGEGTRAGHFALTSSVVVLDDRNGADYGPFPEEVEPGAEVLIQQSMRKK
jgi:hypothetical protein